MKKILIALLAICLLICFSACDKDGDETADTTGAAAPVETTAPADETKGNAETTERVQEVTDKWTNNY